MKHKRYSEEKIVSLLKEHEAGVRVQGLVRSTMSPSSLFTAGRPSTVPWKCLKPVVCGIWRTRTAV
jgi:hypothetical protein